MKLISADFKNFRLLRDLRLEFSTNQDKPLTVIRAENESGKTTLLVALQWCLYGDDSLPGRRAVDFRLHPIDWDVQNGESVPISVGIDFEVEYQRHSPRHGLITSTDRYRIVRSTTEKVKEATWERERSTISLFELTERGGEPVSNPNAILRNMVPEHLRNVFFTDGDRALSFIEAATSSKRERVERAIRSLLDLDILDATIGHVSTTARKVNRKAKGGGAGNDLTGITARLEEIDDAIDRLTIESSDERANAVRLEEQRDEFGKKIEEALILGNKQQLQQEMRTIDDGLRKTRKQANDAKQQHMKLFERLELGRDLLAPVLSNAIVKLDAGRKQGRFPKTAVPVLEDRLRAADCICGETLSPEDSDGLRRRKHIEHLIEDSRSAEEVQATLTGLYFGSTNLNPDSVPADGLWTDWYYRINDIRDDLEAQDRDLGIKHRELEAKIDGLEDTDIDGLRESYRLLEDQSRRAHGRHLNAEATLKNLSQEKSNLSRRQRTLLAQQESGRRILAEARVVEDIRGILSRTYDRITKEELLKVSHLMNTYFLEMIGADPEQGALIRSAAINDRFDILVYGPNDRMLDPDRDLNGGSRRALTLAFILALTRVSEVQAPNVIDTPLGMMSGYVKTSVLQKAIKESSQLVLFLTRAEIAGCEDILDDSIGEIITLTNPTHYPLMLKNDPGVEEMRLLQCNCDHRSECEICERRMSVQTG